MEILDDPTETDRKSYRDLYILSTQTDPLAFSINPEKYTTYSKKKWEKKLKWDKNKKNFLVMVDWKLIWLIWVKLQWKNWFLSTLYVAPNHRWKWIASKLMDVALEYLKKNNCESIYLRVNSSQKGAISLYIKKWFSRLPTKDWHKIYIHSPKQNTEEKFFFIKKIGR